LLCVYEELGEQLPQFKDYEKLFGNDARVREILACIYTDILDFHKRALKVFSRRGTQFPLSYAAIQPPACRLYFC
jgi:hypothetical protein